MRKCVYSSLSIFPYVLSYTLNYYPRFPHLAERLAP